MIGKSNRFSFLDPFKVVSQQHVTKEKKEKQSLRIQQKQPDVVRK